MAGAVKGADVITGATNGVKPADVQAGVAGAVKAADVTKGATDGVKPADVQMGVKQAITADALKAALNDAVKGVANERIKAFLDATKFRPTLMAAGKAAGLDNAQATKLATGDAFVKKVLEEFNKPQ